MKVPNVVITESGIVAALLNLSAIKSCGPDGILNAFFFKRYAECSAKCLHTIFVKSLEQRRIPRKWKLAKVIPTVIPIYTSGGRSTNISEHSICNHVSSLLEASGFLREQHRTCREF